MQVSLHGFLSGSCNELLYVHYILEAEDRSPLVDQTSGWLWWIISDIWPGWAEPSVLLLLVWVGWMSLSELTQDEPGLLWFRLDELRMHREGSDHDAYITSRTSAIRLIQSVEVWRHTNLRVFWVRKWKRRKTGPHKPGPTILKRSDTFPLINNVRQCNVSQFIQTQLNTHHYT